MKEMEEKMNYPNHKEDFEALCNEGFTEQEVRRLIQLRSDQTELEIYRDSAEYLRLAFVRWLVANGKLSDQLA